MDDDDKLLVAAIDFGSSAAGYAFSFRHDYKRDPLDISTFLWTTKSHDITSNKAPCTVLLDLEKRFIAFGYDAEDRFEKILSDNLQDDWYYFNGFKMLLYKAIEEGQDISRDFKIKDFGGKPVSARRVFSIAIGHLRKHLLDQLEQRNIGIKEDEIWWTITVPSIWTEPAKEFMMQCAERAHLSRERVMILFEPEAASIYCRLLPVDKFVGANHVTSFKTFEAGKKYIVVDAGGGTVNISTQILASGNEMDMLYKVSGGPWGGDKLNEAFIKLLENIFTEKIIGQFKDFNGSDFLDLMRQFEVKKKTYRRSTKNEVVIRIPFELSDLYENYGGQTMNDAIDNSSYAGKIKFKRGKLYLTPDIFEDLYADIVKHIVEELRKILEHPNCSHLSAILMVGGFSESEVLQLEIQNAFPRVQVFVPVEGGLAVMKGAVIYGHNPHTFRTRLCNFTYGVNAMLPFSRKRHPPENRVMWNGKAYCANIFRVLFTVNEEIKEGDVRSIRVIDAFEGEEEQSNRRLPIKVQIFASDKEEPVYTTEQYCRLHAEIIVSPPGGKWPRRVFGTVELEFAGTEMIGTYIADDTGRKTCTRFEFLPSVSSSIVSLKSAISGKKRASSARSGFSRGVLENMYSSKTSLRPIDEEEASINSRRGASAMVGNHRASMASLDTIADEVSLKGSLMLNRGNIVKTNSKSTIYSNINDQNVQASSRSLKKQSMSQTSLKSSESDEIRIEVD